MRSRSWLLAAAMLAAVQVSPLLEPVSAQGTPGIVISEFRFRGPSGAGDEFIELFNASSRAVDVGGWEVWGSDNSAPVGNVLRRAIIPAGTVMQAGCFFLLNSSGFIGPLGDLPYAANFVDAGGIALITTAGVSSDQVGLGLNGAYGEGARLSPLTQNTTSYERKPGGADGHRMDSQVNADDFQVQHTPNPQNSSSPCLKPAVLLTHEVQGNGPVSPLTGADVTVRGVVTARTNTGFFLQTADTDAVDGDDGTSEGLFVAHTSPAAQVGRVLEVAGTVTEFLPPSDPGSAPVTQLRSVTSVVHVGESALPEPHVLTSTDLDPAGSADQLEHLEGMRVTASLRSVSGSGLDGSFYAVLDDPHGDAGRPFRERGIEAGAPALPCAGGPCAFERFDGNPERLRVDADGIVAPLVNLAAGAVMNNVTGPLDFAMRAYTLLPESPLVPAGGVMMSAAPAAGSGQFAIASLNLGGVAADAAAHQTRLAKASLMVRVMLNEPDVIAVQQAENATVLNELAGRIDADAAAAGFTAPGYVAFLDGFLAKASRVSATAESLDDPALDRPSVMLHAVVDGGPQMLPQRVTVINNQLRPLADVGRDDDAGHQARLRRRAQAEWLARFVENRQLNDPGEGLVLLGNFNAHAFNDGYVDVMGTVSGAPAPSHQVVLDSPDLVSSDLVNLGGTLAERQRYSSVDNGNAQSLDHVLASANLIERFAGFSYARVNADFPDALHAVADNPGRLSDRDPAVAYFSFPPDVDAPVFGEAPNQLAEATGPSGAIVEFALPAATDNLDEVVVVSCTPASGSVFRMGNTGVRCSAQDAAGNSAEAWFTVMVQDTLAPVLTVPAEINEEASSAAGRVITFAASASDAVSGSIVVSCVPASGSTFPIGTTAVDCSASDAAGNLASASFSVTVTRPVPGRMHGGGTVLRDEHKVAFTFDVGESANFTERGWLMLLSKDGTGKPRHYAAKVSTVTFSDDDVSVDTVAFSGVGSWQGLPNYAFTVTASDRGEPGAGRDTFSVVVTSPTGQVVESTAGVLHGGNVQSLRERRTSAVVAALVKRGQAAAARARVFVRALRREAGR